MRVGWTWSEFQLGNSFWSHPDANCFTHLINPHFDSMYCSRSSFPSLAKHSTLFVASADLNPLLVIVLFDPSFIKLVIRAKHLSNPLFLNFAAGCWQTGPSDLGGPGQSLPHWNNSFPGPAAHSCHLSLLKSANSLWETAQGSHNSGLMFSRSPTESG